MVDNKFWTWFLDKVYSDFSTGSGSYNYNTPELYVLKIHTKQGLYGSKIEVYFDPTKPNSNVFVKFANPTAGGTKIGRRVFQFFKDLTFKDIEPLLENEPFNLSFETEKESLSTDNLARALKLVDKRFKMTKEGIFGNRWKSSRDIINFLEDMADYSNFEAVKIATTYLNIIESGIHINTASQNFSEYENTGTYNVVYSKPFVVYFNFEYEVDAKDEVDAKKKFQELVDKNLLDDKEFKNVRVNRNNLQYGVPYNPYNKMTGKRQVIKVERTG